MVILSDLRATAHKTHVKRLKFVYVLALTLPLYFVIVLFWVFFNTLLKEGGDGIFARL